MTSPSAAGGGGANSLRFHGLRGAVRSLPRRSILRRHSLFSVKTTAGAESPVSTPACDSSYEYRAHAYLIHKSCTTMPELASPSVTEQVTTHRWCSVNAKEYNIFTNRPLLRGVVDNGVNSAAPSLGAGTRVGATSHKSKQQHLQI